MSEQAFRPKVTLPDGREVEFIEAVWGENVDDVLSVDSVAVIVTVMVDGGVQRIPIRLTREQIIEGLGS